MFALWPLSAGIAFITFWSLCSGITFFAFKCCKLLSREVGIGKRVALVTLWTLWACVSLVTLWTLWALDALNTLWASRTCIALVTLWALRTCWSVLTLRANRALNALGAYIAGIALWASRAGGSSVSLFAFFTCVTLFSARRFSGVGRADVPIAVVADVRGDTVSTSSPRFTIRAVLTFRPVLTRNASRALRALRTGWTGVALVAFLSLRAPGQQP